MVLGVTHGDLDLVLPDMVCLTSLVDGPWLFLSIDDVR